MHVTRTYFLKKKRKRHKTKKTKNDDINGVFPISLRDINNQKIIMVTGVVSEQYIITIEYFYEKKR
jgi:hypothetical protein